MRKSGGKMEDVYEAVTVRILPTQWAWITAMVAVAPQHMSAAMRPMPPRSIGSHLGGICPHIISVTYEVGVAVGVGVAAGEGVGVAVGYG